MNWHKLSLNPKALENLFERVPNLENVELFSINLDREGAKLLARFNLPEFPHKPSAKWNKHFNTAQIQVSFWGISNFEAKGWEYNMEIDIEIFEVDNLFSVKFSNPEIKLTYSFLCEFFRIENISAYETVIEKKI